MPIRFPFLILSLFLLTGCGGASAVPELVWGRHGVQKGDLVKPRAVAIDQQDRLFVVDFTARTQVYDRDGKYLGFTWTTPDYSNGRPSGLSIDRDGNLLLSDSHYNCVRVYTPEGKLLRTFTTRPDSKPGDFIYISDAVQDEDGYYYVAESGENEQITKLNSDGQYVTFWGAPGSEPGQFKQIRSLALGPDGNLYVADACNHRLQVFTRHGRFVRSIGKPGKELGEFKYPYDLDFSRGPVPYLYVVEYGNHRLQKFTLEGEPLGCWGEPGRKPGNLNSPWALAVDSKNRIHVMDSMNHRVQRIFF